MPIQKNKYNFLRLKQPVDGDVSEPQVEWKLSQRNQQQEYMMLA